MAHNNTLLQKVQQEISRHVFESAEMRHFKPGDTRKFSNKNLFTFWLYVHIKAIKSLRGAIDKLNFCAERLYHLGFSDTLKRSTVSDALSKRTYNFFEDLFRTELAFTQRQFKRNLHFHCEFLTPRKYLLST